jgi:hypothetical protein
MLVVSVSFLAVPGVVLYNINSNDILKNMHQAVILTSSSQIAGTISVEASVGSIVVGLLLVRHNRTRQEASPSEAVSEQLHVTCVWVTFAQASYLDQNCRKIFGLEPMAIVYSLPWALLMWSYAISLPLGRYFRRIHRIGSLS